MSQLKSISVFSVLLLISCVTINVYFPAAAADSAAKTIVRDVLGEQDAPAAEQAPPAAEEGSRREETPSWKSSFTAVIDLVIPPALAQADIKIDTPVIKQLRVSLKKRQPRIQPYLKSGALGLDRNALVAIRQLGSISLKDRNRVKKWVADENRDRNALYREIARANGHPEWEKDIRKTFARVWVQESRGKIWYQGSQGKWVQKK
ncbi:MAG: DUF1318 domain-containing protein [Pseudomonadota bacterium]